MLAIPSQQRCGVGHILVGRLSSQSWRLCRCGFGSTAKYDAELAAEEKAIKENKNKEQEAKKAAGGWRNLVEVRRPAHHQEVTKSCT